MWRDRSYLLFWLARTVSVSGSALTNVVMPVLVFRLTGSALATSLLATFEALPYLAFGLFAGALADRLNRRRLMVCSDLVNALLLGSIPLAAVFHRLTLIHIYAVAMLSATAFVWFDSASFGALPKLVGRERIVEANSAIFAAETVASIAGPAVAGVLAATIGPARTVVFDALSYASSAVLLSLVPRPFSTERSTEDTETGPLAQRIASDIREGLRFLWRQRVVRVLTLLVSGLAFSGGAVTGLLVVYAVRALGLASNDARIGLLFASGSTGSLLATLLLPHLSNWYPTGRVALAGISLNLLFLLGLVAAPGFVSALVLFGLWELSYSIVTIGGISLRQTVTPDHLQSRVNSSARMIGWGGAPLGAAIGGLVASVTTIRVAYLVMAIGVAISAVIGWFSPLRETSDEGPIESGKRGGSK